MIPDWVRMPVRRPLVSTTGERWKPDANHCAAESAKREIRANETETENDMRLCAAGTNFR